MAFGMIGVSSGDRLLHPAGVRRLRPTDEAQNPVIVIAKNIAGEVILVAKDGKVVSPGSRQDGSRADKPMKADTSSASIPRARRSSHRGLILVEEGSSSSAAPSATLIPPVQDQQVAETDGRGSHRDRDDQDLMLPRPASAAAPKPSGPGGSRARRRARRFPGNRRRRWRSSRHGLALLVLDRRAPPAVERAREAAGEFLERISNR
jgi:hypothetical protein